MIFDWTYGAFAQLSNYFNPQLALNYSHGPLNWQVVTRDTDDSYNQVSRSADAAYSRISRASDEDWTLVNREA